VTGAPSDEYGMTDESKPEKVTGRSRVEDKTNVEKTKVEDKTKNENKQEPGNPISPTTGEYIGD
jgi:hypothetical protein